MLFRSRLAAAAVGAVDDLGIDARLHGVEDVAAGEVDGAGPVEVEVDVGALGGWKVRSRVGVYVRNNAAGGKVAQSRKFD